MSDQPIATGESEKSAYDVCEPRSRSHNIQRTKNSVVNYIKGVTIPCFRKKLYPSRVNPTCINPRFAKGVPGPVPESNRGPLAPKARIIPLDQAKPTF